MFIQSDQKLRIELREGNSSISMNKNFIGTWEQLRAELLKFFPEAANIEKTPVVRVVTTCRVEGKIITKSFSMYGVPAKAIQDAV